MELLENLLNYVALNNLITNHKVKCLKMKNRTILKLV